MAQENGLIVLLVEKATEISKRLAFALESAWGASVYEARDSQTALEFASHLKGLSLIVLGNPNEMDDLCQYVVGNECPEEVLFVAVVEQRLKDPEILSHPRCLGAVARDQYIEELMGLLGDRLFPGGQQEEVKTEDFVRMRADLLLCAKSLDADVFIQLSENKYLKLFREGEMIASADIQKYRDRNIEYFYVKREDTPKFLEQFRSHIADIVRDDTIESVAVRALSKDIQQTVHWMVGQIGVTEEVRELTRSNVELVIKSIGKNPKLSSVFDRICREEGQYVVNHSLMLAEVSCVLASNVDWLADFSYQKLVVASLFHDITVKHHDLARVRRLEELQRRPDLLLLDSFEDYRSHPLKAAELIKELGTAPAEVLAVVSQHHECADGSGFPSGMTFQQLSPLSCLFIVAHDFIDFMLENPTANGLQEFFYRYQGHYSKGNFARIVKSLEDKLSKE